MGADDRNEGHAAGECVEHVWVMTGMTVAADGTHMAYECDRCEAALVVGPDEIAGRTG